MSKNLRNAGLGLMVITMVTVFGATSSFAAGPFNQPRLRPIVPGPVGSPVVPVLGIYGHVRYGMGMIVDSVIPGTTARRMGLEQGDVIRRINGQEIATDRDYRQAMMHAARFDNGVVNLQIIDSRTGRRVVRMGHVNANPGVIMPRSVVHGPSML